MEHNKERISEEDELDLLGLKDLARARERHFVTRIVLAMCGLGCWGYEEGPFWAAIVFSIILVSQILDIVIRRRIVPPERTTPVGPRARLILVLSGSQSSTCYCLITVLAWVTGEPGWQMFAGFWLLGCMLHVLLHMHHDHGNFLGSLVPISLLAIGMPSGSLLFEADPDMTVLLVQLSSSSVFIAHIAVAYPAFSEAIRSLRLGQLRAEAGRETAERASQAKTEYLATLSHEIRTPMNGIVGMATALEDIDLPAEARSKFDVMRKANEMLMGLVNDVLDLSKIEAGRLSLERKPFSLEATVDRVADVFRYLADRKGVAIQLEFDDVGTPRLGDEHRLSQVLQNLIGNALKFTDEGQVKIRVAGSLDGSDMVRIAIEDTGIGMTAEELERMFEPFARSENVVAQQYGGTGLGLAVTEGLVSAMGGRLSAESEKGHGSCFVIHLPLPFAEEITPQEVLQFAPVDRSIEGCSVLAVDDNRVNLQVLDALLKHLGADAVLASSGAEGLELFKAGDFDLVLLDISMPDLDGPTVLRRMKRMAEATGTYLPPVLAVSAHVLTEDIEESLSNGFAGYVTKPIRVNDLKNAANRVLSRAPMAAAAAG